MAYSADRNATLRVATRIRSVEPVASIAAQYGDNTGVDEDSTNPIGDFFNFFVATLRAQLRSRLWLGL